VQIDHRSTRVSPVDFAAKILGGYWVYGLDTAQTVDRNAARSREAASKRKYCDLHKMMRIV